MKIAIDARMINMSGIGVYIQQLLKNSKYDVVLGNSSDIKTYKNCKKIIDYNTGIYGIKEQIKFPYKKLKKEKVDVLHVPHYNVPIFYRGKMVVTIHDLTHLVFPEFLPNKLAKYYAKFMLWVATKKASKILTVSENTKNDIIKMFKVNPDKIKVVYNGVGEEFKKKSKKDIEYLYDKFSIPKSTKKLMFVGNLKPHKNVKTLLEAFVKLDDKEDYSLLLVGKAFSNYDELNELIDKFNIKNQVIATGLVSQDELVDLYNLADLFVFPTLYEGFGLPILESLACGTPVIASNNSSLPEVGGDAIGYFDALDADEISLKIKEYTKKNKISNKKMLEQVNKFSWGKAVKETRSVINSVKSEKD